MEEYHEVVEIDKTTNLTWRDSGTHVKLAKPNLIYQNKILLHNNLFINGIGGPEFQVTEAKVKIKYKGWIGECEVSACEDLAKLLLLL